MEELTYRVFEFCSLSSRRELKRGSSREAAQERQLKRGSSREWAQERELKRGNSREGNQERELKRGRSEEPCPVGAFLVHKASGGLLLFIFSNVLIPFFQSFYPIISNVIPQE